MRNGRLVGIVVLAAVAASCGSSGHSEKNAGTTTACVIASTTTTTTDVGVRFPPGVTVIGGNPVPTTVVAPRCLPAGHITDALQVAAAIRAAGLGCETVDLDHPKPVPEIPGRQLIEQVSCDVGDETVTITLTPEPILDLTLMRAGVCFVNKTHPGNLTYVDGTNWNAFPETAATALLLADRLHEPTRSVHCWRLRR
jgi:hypothetical protein